MSRQKALLALMLVSALLVVPQMRASGHANLVQAEPANGAILGSSPQRVVLGFSEPLDPAFSSLRLVESLTQQDIPGDLIFDPGQPKQIQLSIPDLPEGVYAVLWEARSTVDGHITRGALTFSVGTKAGSASLLPPPGSIDPATALPPWSEVLVRWLGYLGLALVLGSPVFLFFVLRPGSQEEDAAGASLVRSCQIVGSSVLGVASLGQIGVQFWQITAGSASLSQFFAFISSGSGLLLGVRLGASIGLAVWSGFFREKFAPGRRGWLPGAILGLAAWLTFPLQSHLAAAGSWPGALGTGLHILAMSVWIGGLVPLGITLSTRRSSPESSGRIVLRFSRLAMGCVALLVLSGLTSAWIETGGLEALIHTTYGRALLVKTGIFALILVLAAANLLFFSPRLRNGNEPTRKWLARSVALELGLGSLVLVMAGVLTSTNPAKDAYEASRALGFDQTARVDQTRLRLLVAPVKVGENEFGVEFTDPSGPDRPAQVVLRLSTLDAAYGVTEIQPEARDGKRFTARGSYLPAGGSWQIEVIVRRAGMDDVRHTFNLNVPGATGVNPGQATLVPNPIPANPESIAAGQTAYQEYCAACHGESGAGNGPLSQSLNPKPADLTQHAVVGIHPDAQLFEWISAGYPNSAMPGFAETLSEERRWDVVNYIRTLAQPD